MIWVLKATDTLGRGVYVESNYVAKRLDRVFCCARTRLKWQDALVSHLPFLSSDHSPLYIQLCPDISRDPTRRPFRFEAAWLSHPGFKELLVNSWNANLSTPQALEGLRETLQLWNKEIFGDVQRRKEKAMSELKYVQDKLEQNPSDDLLQKDQLMKEYEVILEQEEIILFQKSREKWIALGDRNTSYFHTSTIIRRRRNRVEMLKNDEGGWISEPKELENLAVSYYKRLYSMEDVEAVVDKLPP